MGLGVLAALGLEALLRGFGIALPTGPLVFEPRTALVCLAVGVGVTVIAAIRPTRNAVRIPRSPRSAIMVRARRPSMAFMFRVGDHPRVGDHGDVRELVPRPAPGRPDDLDRRRAHGTGLLYGPTPPWLEQKQHRGQAMTGAAGNSERLALAALTWITEPGDTRLDVLSRVHGRSGHWN